MRGVRPWRGWRRSRVIWRSPWMWPEKQWNYRNSIANCNFQRLKDQKSNMSTDKLISRHLGLKQVWLRMLILYNANSPIFKFVHHIGCIYSNCYYRTSKFSYAFFMYTLTSENGHAKNQGSVPQPDAPSRCARCIASSNRPSIVPGRTLENTSWGKAELKTLTKCEATGPFCLTCWN